MTSVAYQPEAITAEDAAARMAAALLRGGRFERSVLLFAVYRAEVTRAHAEALLVARLEAEGTHITRVYFPYGGDADWPAQFANSRPPANEVFFLYNLQQEFPALLDQLNYRRELLTISQVRAVFWVTETELAQIAEFAPDFFRFRTEVLELLDVPPMDQRSALAELVFHRDQDINSAMNVADRQAYIALRERLLADLGQDASTAGTRSDLLLRLGDVHLYSDEHKQAIMYYQQALALALKIGDRRSEGHALSNLGLAYMALGEVQRGINYHEQDLEIARETGNRRREGRALGNLGLAYIALRETRRAIGFFEQSLTIMREIGDKWSEGHELNKLGLAYLQLGEVSSAIGSYEQVVTIMSKTGNQQGYSNVLGSLGLAYLQLGNVQRAINLFKLQLDLVREIGNWGGEGTALNNLGSAYLQLGEVQRATGYYEQALTVAREIGDRRGEATASWSLGLLWVQQGDMIQAATLMQVMVDFERDIGHSDSETDAAKIEELRQHFQTQAQAS